MEKRRGPLRAVFCPLSDQNDIWYAKTRPYSLLNAANPKSISQPIDCLKTTIYWVPHSNALVDFILNIKKTNGLIIFQYFFIKTRHLKEHFYAIDN